MIGLKCLHFHFQPWKEENEISKVVRKRRLMRIPIILLWIIGLRYVRRLDAKRIRGNSELKATQLCCVSVAQLVNIS